MQVDYVVRDGQVIIHNQGRFTQRDPLGYTDGLNPYLYVHNNPVNYSDPNGLLARQVGTWWDAQDASYHLNTRIAVGFQAIGVNADLNPQLFAAG